MADAADTAPTTAPPPPRLSARALLPLTLTTVGVVYGDIGTSPLYTIRECFFPNWHTEFSREPGDIASRSSVDFRSRPPTRNGGNVSPPKRRARLARVIERAVQLNVMKPNAIGPRDSLQSAHLM